MASAVSNNPSIYCFLAYTISSFDLENHKYIFWELLIKAMHLKKKVFVPVVLW